MLGAVAGGLLVAGLVLAGVGFRHLTTAPSYPADPSGITSLRRGVTLAVLVAVALSGTVLVAAVAWAVSRVAAPARKRLVAAGTVGCATAAVTVVLLVAVVQSVPLPAGAFAQSSTSPTVVAPETGFGGYTRSGDVTQISAQWRVPTIAPDSPPGHAATWIGAQSAGGGYPFIQVGITEDAFGTGPPIYEGFWSDTTADFHPEPFGVVAAGDLVAASMVRTAQGWTVTLDDQTTGTPVSTLVPYGVGASFTEAEWIEEDPSPSDVTAQDLPYPQMTPVTFQDLRVDGTPPQLTLGDGMTLTTSNGIVLVPSPVEDDSFTFAPPTGPAAQYLADAASLDTALARFAVAFTSGGSTPAPLRALEAAQLSLAYSTNARDFRDQSWPSTVQPAMALLAQRLEDVVNAIQAWTASGAGASGPAFDRLHQAQEVRPLVDQVRADLGLPPP